MNLEKICLIGLGKLGLPLLAVFAKNKQKIIGVDVDKAKIKILENGEVPFYENDLQQYLIQGKQFIQYTDSLDKIENNIDVFIILVNTPSNENGEFSNEYIENVIDAIFQIKKDQQNKFLLIISSTVMPGSINCFIDKIKETYNSRLNENFGIVYIPDLVALGSVIHDFQNPDVVILGESCSEYGEIAAEVFSKILNNNPPIVRMSLNEAEIAKVSLNAYITMKISFANFLGNVAEKFGSNPDNITKALGYDKRISPHYFKSGLAFGGTCFPRDTFAFIKMAEKINLDAIHIKATQEINDLQNQLLFEKAIKFKNKKIGIYGLAFKPKTYVTTESPGFILYNKLIAENCDVSFYDNVIPSRYIDLDEFIEDNDVIIITHPTKFDTAKDLNGKIIINCWDGKKE